MVPHPLNWRTHPASQLDALRGVLAEVGVADCVKGFELPDGRVQLIDGHARAEILPDQEIPVLILDVTEDEARKLLATFDPLGDLAGANAARLDELLRQCDFDAPALAQLADELLAKHNPAAAPEPEAGQSETIPEQFQVLIICAGEAQQASLLEELAGRGLTVRSLIS